MKEHVLPSGAVLKLLHTPFSESKTLYQAVMEEFKHVKFDTKQDYAAIMKDLFCASVYSPKVDAALKICMGRCTYNDRKIDDTTFDPPENRQDYSVSCLRVMEENLSPFLNGLFAEFARLSQMIASAQTLRP